jgi:hypothetical protein
LVCQTSYTKYLTKLPKTDILNELSTRELRSLKKAMEFDKKLGELTWELYQVHKQIRARCDFEGVDGFPRGALHSTQRARKHEAQVKDRDRKRAREYQNNGG